MGLEAADWEQIVKQSEGYSGSDLKHVVHEAYNSLVMEAQMEAHATGKTSKLQIADVRPLNLQDLQVRWLLRSIACPHISCLQGFLAWDMHSGLSCSKTEVLHGITFI